MALPINTDEIQQQINHLSQRRQQLKDEFDAIDSLKGELPRLEEERSQPEHVRRKRNSKTSVGSGWNLTINDMIGKLSGKVLNRLNKSDESSKISW